MNTRQAQTPLHLAESRDALETRLGLALAAGLTQQAQTVHPDISERLRVARQQAVARAAQVRAQRAPASEAAAASTSVVVGRSGAAVLGAGTPPTSLWWRAAAVLPLVLLVAGLLGIDHQHERKQAQAMAALEAELLADDLPPDAYTDPGFAEFLRRDAAVR